MRKAVLSPSFEHYLASFGNEDVIVLILKGHLVIEALLVELLQTQEHSDKYWKLSFPKKCEALTSFGLLTSKQAEAIINFNEIRNDIAHILGHKVTFDRIFELAKKAAEAGFDFSDDTIHQNRKLSEEWYGISGGLIDILNAFYFDLAWILKEAGGSERF